MNIPTIKQIIHTPTASAAPIATPIPIPVNIVIIILPSLCSGGPERENALPVRYRGKRTLSCVVDLCHTSNGHLPSQLSFLE